MSFFKKNNKPLQLTSRDLDILFINAVSHTLAVGCGSDRMIWLLDKYKSLLSERGIKSILHLIDFAVERDNYMIKKHIPLWIETTHKLKKHLDI